MPWIDIKDKEEFSPAKMAKVALCESERMLFDVYCLEPGQHQRTHTHGDIDKIYVVAGGRPTVVLGTEERVLATGQAAWAPAGLPHGLRNDTAERATLLVFQARTPQPAPPGQGQRQP